MKINNEKEQYCYFFLRGCCMFSEEICKYSHSLEHLKYFK